METVLAFQPKSVLFLCHGNACRSPFAAAVFAAELRKRGLEAIGVESAGLVAPGRPSPPQAIHEAKRRGFDLSAHRSRIVTTRLIRSVELAVVMSPDQARTVLRVTGTKPIRVILLGDLDPESTHGRTIVDPMGKADTLFVESFDRVERCVRELAALLVASPPAAGPSSDRNASDSAGP